MISNTGRLRYETSLKSLTKQSPTADLTQSIDKAPSKAVNAESSQASRLSIDENRKRWVVFNKDNTYTPETSAQPHEAAIDRNYPDTHTVSGPHQSELSQHKPTDVSPLTPVVNDTASHSQKERTNHVWTNVPEELFVKMIAPLNHRDRVALSHTSSAFFNAIIRHVATWHPTKFEHPVIAELDTRLHKISKSKMTSPSDVLFVDILMPTTDKYYLESKDGRTTTHDRDIVAQYEVNYRKELLRLIGSGVRTHDSIKNLSFIANDELTPNVLNRILEAMPSVDYVSLIRCHQFNYETTYCFDVSVSAPELYLECLKPHNFASGPFLHANSTALLWVYCQIYRSRMTGEALEHDADTDSEYDAYGIAETPSDAPARPWDEQNHIIGIGSSAESLLANQMRNNPNFLRQFSRMLIGPRENGDGPRMIKDMITGETDQWELASILNYLIGSGKRLEKNQTLDVLIAVGDAPNSYKV